MTSVHGGPAVTKPSRKQVVDQLMDAYVAWREASVQLRDAYASWGAARRADTKEAFEQYAVALDKEGRAADAYASMTRRAQWMIGTEETAAASGRTPTRQP